MAISFTLPDGSTQVIPGATASITPAASNSGLAANGIIAIVGESSAGPDFSREPNNLVAATFGPADLPLMRAKYGTGRLVDAFAIAAQPSKDPAIPGAPSKIIVVKTNPSVASSLAIADPSSVAYGVLYALSPGQAGNQLQETITAATAEAIPTTGTFSYIPSPAAVALTVRVNGGSDEALTVSANEAPNTLQAALGGLTGIACTGGADRHVIGGVAGTLSATVTGYSVVFTRSVAFDVQAVVGDTLLISNTSVVANAGANVGAYVVTGSTPTTITATKLSDSGHPGAAAGTVTAPNTIGAQAIASTTADLQVFSPLTVSLSNTTPINGTGKTLEINDLRTGGDDQLAGKNGGTGTAQGIAYILGTTTGVTFGSITATPVVTNSATEYSVTLNSARAFDAVNESLTAGGQIVLSVGYKGTTGTLTIGATTFSTTVTGGTGANIPATLLSAFATVADLVAYINTLTGYTAKAGNAALAQLPLTALDEGTYGIGSDFGALTGCVKADAYQFFKKVSGSAVVGLAAPASTYPFTAKAAPSGLPGTKAATFMTGGTLGGTTNAAITAALSALEKVQAQFVNPCMSQDASKDILTAETDSSSTYTIAFINASTLTHALKMSQLKRRKNRFASCSIEDTYANQKQAAANLASARAICAPLDVTTTSVSTNQVTTFQPWAFALTCVAMQAAGFRLDITGKQPNITSVSQAAGDLNVQDDDQVEDALESGLILARLDNSDQLTIVEDQTTYSRDDNFFFNSLQAMYVGDIIALTSAARMERAFKGQTLADVNASMAKTAFEAIMRDFMRLKLIAASDDAPLGYKGLSVKVAGPVMAVNVEVKEATGVKFIPISFLVTQIVQSA